MKINCLDEDRYKEKEVFWINEKEGNDTFETDAEETCVEETGTQLAEKQWNKIKKLKRGRDGEGNRSKRHGEKEIDLKASLYIYRVRIEFEGLFIYVER